MKIHIYLNFPGNTKEAFDFYKSVFGGEFDNVTRFKDMPMEGSQISEEDENKIMHMSLPIGDEVLMGSDATKTMGHSIEMGNNFYVSVHPDSKDEADRIFSALSKDGKVEQQIMDAPWGDYWGALRDKFGVQWMVNYSPSK